MKITVENYRSIKAASLELGSLALVAAPNAAGKSAIAQAMGAVLSGQPVPIPGINKAMAGMLVRNGASVGFAQLDSDAGTARVDWPRALLKTKGTPPQISALAAGIELLTPPHGTPDDAARQKRRAELLIEVLDALPTFEHLRARFKRDGINEDVARAVWEIIEKQGWSAAHAQAKETGARIKGQWEATTGENYGSKKAENYTPNNWEPELGSASEESLRATITDARDALEGMIAIAAIDDAERERLQCLADTLQERKAAHDAAITAKQTAAQEHTDAKAAMQALRDPNAVQGHECPHCQGALSIVGGKVVKGSPISADEVAAWNAADGQVSCALTGLNAAITQLADASAPLTEATSAAEQLASLAQGNASQDQINSARQSLQIAQERLDAFMKKTRADRLQNAITQNISIVSALDTGGVRQEVVSEKINTLLTESVNPLAKKADWLDIEIAADMSISYGGRAWALLSESERYRVRVLFQVAIGLREGAAALVIDAADILDKAGRNGLVTLLRHAAIPTIVCMTFPTPADVPDFKAAGIGDSYWICDGVLAPLNKVHGSVSSTNA